MFVDSHAHLEGHKYDSDREDVLARAQAAGVEAILAIGNGEGPGSLDCALKLAQSRPWIYATTGIHPHEAKLANDTAYGEMERIAQHDKVVAWGEIGLDYYYDHSPRDVQKEVFVRQLELARAAKLPIIIHCRPSDNSTDAWDDCLGLIRDEWNSSGLGGVLHCFTGELEHSERALDMGFMISFAGNVTFPKAQNIRDAAKAVPLDRMFIETDSPYLAPIPYRGKRNEPAYVVETARYIAQLRGIGEEDLGRATTDNFYKFFEITEKRD